MGIQFKMKAKTYTGQTYIFNLHLYHMSTKEVTKKIHLSFFRLSY